MEYMEAEICGDGLIGNTGDGLIDNPPPHVPAPETYANPNPTPHMSQHQKHMGLG